MRMRFGTRVWLAWKVIRGFVIEGTYDTRDDTTRITLGGPVAQRAWMESMGRVRR